jgi:hypothetical protein
MLSRPKDPAKKTQESSINIRRAKMFHCFPQHRAKLCKAAPKKTKVTSPIRQQLTKPLNFYTLPAQPGVKMPPGPYLS